MNTGLVKRISLLLLMPTLTFTTTAAHGQTTKGGEVPPPPSADLNSRYNIEITNGKLSLAPINGKLSQIPLKGRTDLKAIWGTGDIESVPATIENLAKYLKVENPDLNIVLSPGTAEHSINDLKLRSGDMKAITEAVTIATDSKIRGSQLSGKDNWTFMVQRPPNQQQQVEVFNLTGYIEVLNTPNENVIAQKLDEVEQIIIQTLRNLEQRQNGESGSSQSPEFRFHAGTSLLIVMGTPQAIDVSRKIVNALPGQNKQNIQELLDITTKRNQN